MRSLNKHEGDIKQIYLGKHETLDLFLRTVVVKMNFLTKNKQTKNKKNETIGDITTLLTDEVIFSQSFTLPCDSVNSPLSANPTKWPNTLKVCLTILWDWCLKG